MSSLSTAELASRGRLPDEAFSELEQLARGRVLEGAELSGIDYAASPPGPELLEAMTATYPLIEQGAFEALLVSRQGLKLPTAARFWNTMHHLISDAYLDPRRYFPKQNLPNTIDLPRVRERIRMLERGEVFLHELGQRFWNSLADVNNALVINPEEVILPWNPNIHPHFKCHPCPATRRAAAELAEHYALFRG